MYRFLQCSMAVCVSLVSVCISVSAAPIELPETRVKIELASLPLSDVLKSVSDACPANFVVDKSVAHWKATVRFDGKVSDLIQALKSEFRLVVEEQAPDANTAPSAKKTYLLHLSDDELLRLTKYYRDSERRGREQKERDARAFIDQVKGLLADKDPEGPHGVEGGTPLTPGAKPILDLLGSLGNDAINQIADGIANSETPTEATQSFAMQISNLSANQRSLMNSYMDRRAQSLERDAGSRKSPGADLIRTGMQHLDGGSFGFSTANVGGVTQLLMSVRFSGTGGSGAGFPILVTMDPELGKAPAPPEPERAKNKRTPNKSEDSEVSMQGTELDYSQVVIKIASAANLNIVADAFTLAERISVIRDKVSLAKLLDAVEEKFNVESRWEKDVLLVRSMKWEDLTQEEPANDSIKIVEESARQQRLLSLLDMAHLAQLNTRRQLLGLARWHNRTQEAKPEAKELRTRYVLYRWIGSLSDEQILKLNTEGIRTAKISLKNRNSFSVLVRGRAGIQNVDLDTTLSVRPDTVKYPPTLCIEIRKPDGAVLAELR